MHRVQKLISNYGYCSRRKAEELIIAGKVKVNGKVISIGDKASEDDKISVDGKIVKKEKKLYLIFNKPVGCVTALKDPEFMTIMSYVKVKERVFPVGRLDFNTSGLLLLTNDGDFSNSIMHPRYEIKKTYLANSYNNITDENIKSLEAGINLSDGKTRPAKIKKHSKTSIEITIHEGKQRIVRRMLGALGIKVKTLERIRIGKLELGKLEPGKYKELSEKDKEKIFETKL
ncbi:MAG: pseudouridine synthase [archaeon]